MTVEADAEIVLGVIVGAHGVSGRLRVKPFTGEPEAIGDYGPVMVRGVSREIKVTGAGKGLVTIELEGIKGRDAAEALKGAELTVTREDLGEADSQEEGWFHADLIGLKVETAEGEVLGSVVAVFDFGAGDILEITPADGGATVMMAFTEENVPRVDIASGKLIADPPLGTFESEEEKAKPKPRKRRRSPKAREKALAREKADTGSEGSAGGEADV
jgi:16S rRNA processing protein RimM|tara:strand:- start:161 stop:808 length:648 start_codon:yes stop_codon:yes gene_type:complete